MDAAWVGREVIINPSLDWGGRESAQDEAFSILGLPRDGTLAEKISVPVANLSPKPAHLGWEEAAALPLAGLTAYRALFARAHLKAADRVLITGIGGGVALFALQFAVAHGATVFVTSSSGEKISRAVALGAAGGANYKEEGWAAALARAREPFDVIVDSAGGEGFNDLIELAAPGGASCFLAPPAATRPAWPCARFSGGSFRCWARRWAAPATSPPCWSLPRDTGSSPSRATCFRTLAPPRPSRTWNAADNSEKS